MSRDDDLLRGILEHGEEALGFLGGTGRDEYLADRGLQLITQRLLEILGEAAGALSEEAREAVPFDWRAVRGLRNVLAHQYGHVDHARLYHTLRQDLPALLDAVRGGVLILQSASRRPTASARAGTLFRTTSQTIASSTPK